MTEKHRHQEGGQGAADTQLAPTSWDETKHFDSFLRSCLMTMLLIPKTDSKSRRSFFSHQDEESIEIMTPRQMIKRLGGLSTREKVNG